MTEVSATTAVGSTSDPSVGTAPVSAHSPETVSTPRVPPIDVDVANLCVPTVGRVEFRPGTNLPLVVIDPDGCEMLWVSRALRLLGAEGFESTSQASYAKSALRAFRPMWAAGLVPATLTGIEYSIPRRWLRHCLGIVTKPKAAKPGVVQDATRHLSASTLQQTEAALLAIYDAAVRLGDVAENPVMFFRDNVTDEPDHEMRFDTGFQRSANRRRIAKVPEKNIVTLNPEDRHLLRNAKRPRDRALWTLCLDSGPRISEALSLTLDNYFPEDNYALVVGKGLGGSRRVIPVSDESVEAIDAYLEWLRGKGVELGPHDPIFRTVKVPFEPMVYNAAWKALRRALGNTDIHPHALRHTAATELLDLMDGEPGKRLLRIQQTLGHKSMVTTRRYLHVTVAEVVVAHLQARRSPRKQAHQSLIDAYGENEMALLADIRKEQPDGTG